MAFIDVSELMTDSDFTDSVTLITRVQAINEYGENVLTETSTTATMIVQPASPHDMEFLPEGGKIHETKSVFYKGVFSDMVGSGYTDIILWNGKRYQVVPVDDFTNWGVGYTHALAVMESVSNG
jgi:hypothetical protein